MSKFKRRAPEPPLTPVEPLLYEPHWTGDVLKLLMHITRKINEQDKKLNELIKKVDELTSQINLLIKKLGEPS